MTEHFCDGCEKDRESLVVEWFGFRLALCFRCRMGGFREEVGGFWRQHFLRTEAGL